MRTSRVPLLTLLTLLLAAVSAASEASDPAADQLKWPLIFAAGEGDAETVRSLLAAGADVHERSRDGETALHVSAIRGSLETVRALLDAGAEVDARTPAGATIYMTPSMWATYHRHDAMVAMLLEAGADPTATDEHGKALLTMAHEAQQPKITALLEARLRGVPELPGLPPLHWLRNRAGSATLEGGVLTMVAGNPSPSPSPSPNQP